MRPLPRGLYAITDGPLASVEALEQAVACALRGGAVVIQYRDKSSDQARRLEEASRLARLCRAHGALFIINDDVELALAVKADGVHLGKDDAAYLDARQRLGADAIIGLSCYNDLARAEHAVALGADYIAFGSFFPSTTKPNAARAHPELLTAAKERFALPLVAIGGITAENGAALVDAGADLLAVISDIFRAKDITAAAARYTALFENEYALKQNAHQARLTDTETLAMAQSHDLFLAAQKHIPGGVNSPVRAFRGVGGDPIFFKRAEGAYVWDESDKRYIDYVASWGPAIVGHAHKDVIRAVQESAAFGLSFGAPTVRETEMADLLCQLVPSMEMVRMVSSGTEATMSAIRLARGYTGRDKIVKFEGCYHGHSDSLLVKAGSGMLTLGVPSSPGVPAALAEHTLTLPYNDINAVRETFAQVGKEIACIIVEPVAGNMNCIPPVAGFLEGLRAVCDEYGTVLIFDEVMTGFRVALGGAQAHYKIKPDMTTLGKVVGGGMPVGAFGGKREIMEKIAPLGPVYQAGTLSGNPVAMAAGLVTLKIVQQPNFYTDLAKKTEYLVNGIMAEAKKANIPMSENHVGGMFGLFFTSEAKITSYGQAVSKCDVERFKRFFHGMLNEGVYLAPSAFEAGFVSATHTQADLDATIAAAGRVLRTL